jgi:hypothetical protein
LGADLFLERQVGTHRQGSTLSARRILEPAQLDDTAGRRISHCVEVGETEMMNPAVDVIDDGVEALLQLVIEAKGHKPSYDLTSGLVLESEFINSALDALVCKASMNALDDVIALTDFSKRWLGFFGEPPPFWTDRPCQTKQLKFAHPPDLACLQMPLAGSIG